MGSCVSIHKNKNKNDNVSASKPVKSKSVSLVKPAPAPAVSPFQAQMVEPLPSNVDDDHHTTKSINPDFGSKEETFFDSRPWLDSDCEDDFHSVDGDFTPSCGNTPIRRSDGTPLSDKHFHHESNSTPMVTVPSPIKRRKKLAELFRESIRERHRPEQTHSHGCEKIEANSIRTSHDSTTNSVSGSDWTADEDFITVKQKRSQSSHCIPNLGGSFRRFSSRKKTSASAS